MAETQQVTLTLPILERDEDPPAAATARLQAIFNDFARADHKPRPFGESGAFGDKTEKAIEEFQGKHHLTVDGSVGKQTWKVLLERWMALPPMPLD
jgi:peptidoglycan hydrolase-like protein with peptidoglycan-binding domain